jgi:hypothetical protein
MVCADAPAANTTLAVINSAAIDRFISPPMQFCISSVIMPGIDGAA